MNAPVSTGPLRRNRDFMLLWSSQAVSTVGTRITSIALPLLVLSLTGSPARAGLVAFAATLPHLLFYLPAGALIDRWDRKVVMLVSDGVRTVALGSIVVTLALDSATLAQLALVAFVEGSMFVLFDLAEGAALPRIVPAEQLPAALAQNQARIQAADLIGQPLGGVLFGLGRVLPFLIDTISYAVSFFAVLAVRSRLQEERAAEPTRLRADILEGLRRVWQEPFLRAIVGIAGGMNFVFTGLLLVLIVRARDLDAPPALIGVMFAFSGAGGLLGSAVATRIHRRFSARGILVGCAWLWVALTAVLVLLPNALSLGIVAGVVFGIIPVFNVVVGDHIYRVTPDRLLGRVRSAIRMVSWGTNPLGSLATGLLASAVGAGPTFLFLAAVMLVVAVTVTLARGIHMLPQSG